VLWCKGVLKKKSRFIFELGIPWNRSMGIVDQESGSVQGSTMSWADEGHSSRIGLLGFKILEGVHTIREGCWWTRAAEMLETTTARGNCRNVRDYDTTRELAW
jgi:hypothetical protein